MFLAAFLLSSAAPKTPLSFAEAEIIEAAGKRGGDVHFSILPKLAPESYRIVGNGKTVTIFGGNAVGEMYGAFEFAERLHQRGASAWKGVVEGSPYLRDRGLNLFLTLPWNYQKNDTDYEIGALTDPRRWWFQNEDYWTTLLDLMAHSRLNWLDIHGGWDISVTNAPNLYAYFVTAPSYPLVGVPPEVKQADLRQLNHVIDMAHARGIRVSLMCYEANLKIPQNPNPPYPNDEKNVYKYTREVVEQMIRRAPGLDAIGFRIGESGRSESFFNCYGEAVKASGRDIPLITRSWVTKKQKVLPLARASKDFTVEIKYNGEQWGAPYMVAGGRMANWGSYSYEDYLSDSAVAGASRPRAESRAAQGQDARATAARMWLGNPTSEGSSWPSEPYKIVWQVRANGTHRIFPFYNPDMVRQTIQTMKIGTASGYTIEGEDAYFPKSPDYYLAHPETDKYCDWIHQRDEMYWMCWGRLGYDPKTPFSVFTARLHDWFGPQTKQVEDAWTLASRVIPASYTAHALGPDHRDHAPELETGGDFDSYEQVDPFDTLVLGSFGANLLDPSVADRRASALRYFSGYIRADIVGNQWVSKVDESKFSILARKRYRELKNACLMLSDLADYFDARLEGADQKARLESANGKLVASPALSKFMDQTLKSWEALSNSPEAGYYKPFTDRLRMHTNSFTWAGQLQSLRDETAALRKLPVVTEPKTADADADGFSFPQRQAVRILPSIRWMASAARVRITAAKHGERAWLLVKPLPSSTFFHRLPMKAVGNSWVVDFDRKRCGHCVAAFVVQGHDIERLRWSGPAYPYVVIPAQPGPTPQIYAADEAMTFLDPKILTPNKFGAMLIGTRSGQFFGRFDRATKRKLLEGVKRGLKLVILQEDFGKDKLDFLPQPLNFETGNWTTFDPAGQLGLHGVDTQDIMWQRFLPSDGWEVFGNGGLARCHYGKGEIWVTSARLMQRMIIPAAAKDFAAMLSIGGKTKPTVLIDSGSEGGPLTSSCHPDLMNALGIPFLTLGEAIAQEQGMNSFTPIPGPVWADDVLGGRGSAMANKFLRDQVIAMSKRPTPKNVEAFERERKERRHKLMLSLGLDPMPARTPLNARITGTIQRNGYHIEKLVFESRPRFYVTAHVYVPDPLSPPGERARARGRLPVIMNVNGHWAHKKDEDRVQLRCAFQALQGYIAIAVDSPGWSFEGNNLIERRAEGDHNDWKMVEGGTNTTGYYVWDTMRALDYMATRPDTDMNRIGITGASGGGLATLYAFAADDRYKAAVPVVYMASMEEAPDNGCLCNHVPGTCQIGDRSDVIGIQAPKPVLLMGAENDGEFPPNATRLTQKKMAETWRLFGKDGDTYVKVFPGGHDYNQGMRESMIGFFNRYVKGEGTGEPVQQPTIEAIDSENHELLAADPPIPNERTMRDLSQEYLDHAPKDVPVNQIIDLNGGRPVAGPLTYTETGEGKTRSVTFESEPGLVTPAILKFPYGLRDKVTIVCSDDGKVAAMDKYAAADSSLYLDILGTGELSDPQMRYCIYTGRSVAFTGGWQIVRAAEAMRRYFKHVEIEGHGPLSSLAVMYAALLDPRIDRTTGTGCLKTWQETFGDGVTPWAVQPRAHLMGTLENLRSHVKNGHWSFGG